MPHYQRNIRIFSYFLLPILGFLLGWSLSQKNAAQLAQPQANPQENISNGEATSQPIKIAKPKKFKKTDPSSVDLDIFWETWSAMESSFLYKEKLNARDQVHGATKGLIKSLGDPYTTYMTPEDTSDFEETMSGEFEGIGAEIGIRDERLTVVTPLKGTPAELAGLKSGDQVWQIDGESTLGISIEEAVKKIRGPKGESVTLTVLRKKNKKPLDVVIVRDTILIKNAEYEMKGDIGVITISSFGDNVLKEFTSAVSELVLKNPKGIIIDLRNNPGGHLLHTVKIAKDFLPKKTIVRTRGLSIGQNGDYISGRDAAFENIPLIILVNGGSASASEIFAGAMQDYRRAVVIGEKTFGKGSVQQVVPLSDGSSLKVTIMEWLTPNERSIHDVGIQPHEVIEPTEEEIEAEIDRIMERAIELLGEPNTMAKILEGPIPTVDELLEAAKDKEASELDELKVTSGDTE